jgi:predicted small secreted protein
VAELIWSVRRWLRLRRLPGISWIFEIGCNNTRKEITMAKKLVTLLFIGTMIVLAGCNTVRGVGQDIEKGGEAIQKAVK